MAKLKNRFHTQHTGTYNDHIHVRQTHQAVYELDADNNLKKIDDIDIQEKRNLYIQDVNYKSSFEIDEKTGELKNKNYIGVPPTYGDVSQLPTDMYGVKQLAEARLESIGEQVKQAVTATAKNLNKYNQKIAKKAMEQKEKPKEKLNNE